MPYEYKISIITGIITFTFLAIIFILSHKNKQNEAKPNSQRKNKETHTHWIHSDFNETKETLCKFIPETNSIPVWELFIYINERDREVYSKTLN